MNESASSAALEARAGDKHYRSLAIHELARLVAEAAELAERLVTHTCSSGTEYRNLRAAALMNERKIVEFLLGSKDIYPDDIRPSDFGVSWNHETIDHFLRSKLRERKKKLNLHIAHLKWNAIANPRSWRLARIRFAVEGMGRFARPPAAT